MKNFLSVLGTTASSLALIASIYLIAQVLELKKSVDSLSDSVAVNSKELKTVASSINAVTSSSSAVSVEDKAVESATSKAKSKSDVDVPNNQVAQAIEPGQFVSSGFENRVKLELLSAKRIKNPETGIKDIVNYKLRVRRITPKARGTLIDFRSIKGRHQETNEVFKTVYQRTTSPTSINEIPENAWANAYFWLQVPEDVNTLDIVIPKTAIFNNVPISD